MIKSRNSYATTNNTITMNVESIQKEEKETLKDKFKRNELTFDEYTIQLEQLLVSISCGV